MASIIKIKKTAPGVKPWKAQVNIKGFDRVSKRFFTEDEAETWAEALEETLRAEKKTGEARSDLATCVIKDLIEAYLDDPETKSFKDLKGTARLLKWWVTHYGSTKVIETGPLWLKAARATLQKTGNANATVNRYLGALRTAWNWAPTGGFTIKPWPLKLMLPEPDGRKRFLNDDELAALKIAAAKHSLWMSAAVIASIGCGMRQGELLRLTWGDIDFEKQSVAIRITKNDKPRAVHLPAPAATALKKLLPQGAVPRDQCVFLNEAGKPIDLFYLNHRWEKVRQAAGLVDFRWHDLRHSCASILLQSGASLPEIGSVLGHKSMRSTERYSHLISGKAVTGSDRLAAKLS